MGAITEGIDDLSSSHGIITNITPSVTQMPEEVLARIAANEGPGGSLNVGDTTQITIESVRSRGGAGDTES